MPGTNIEFMPSKLCRLRELTEELHCCQGRGETETDLFFKLSPDMFCIADAEYLKRVNAAWTRILGWTETELLARPLSTFIHPDDVEVTKNVLGHMTEQDTIRFHNRYRKKDSNDYVIFEWNTTRWTDGLIYAIARPVPGSQLKRFTNIGNHQTGNENAT